MKICSVLLFSFFVSIGSAINSFGNLNPYPNASLEDPCSDYLNLCDALPDYTKMSCDELGKYISKYKKKLKDLGAIPEGDKEKEKLWCCFTQKKETAQEEYEMRCANADVLPDDLGMPQYENEYE